MSERSPDVDFLAVQMAEAVAGTWAVAQQPTAQRLLAM